MEIYVNKNNDIAMPSAGSLNLEKEEDNSPGKEVPVSKNSAYVKNLITQKRMQDAKYKAQPVSHG